MTHARRGFGSERHIRPRTQSWAGCASGVSREEFHRSARHGLVFPACCAPHIVDCSTEPAFDPACDSFARPARPSCLRNDWRHRSAGQLGGGRGTAPTRRGWGVMWRRRPNDRRRPRSRRWPGCEGSRRSSPRSVAARLSEPSSAVSGSSHQHQRPTRSGISPAPDQSAQVRRPQDRSAWDASFPIGVGGAAG